MGALFFFKIDLRTFFLSVITLLCLVIPDTGAQSVTADRVTRRSDYLDKDKGV